MSNLEKIPLYVFVSKEAQLNISDHCGGYEKEKIGKGRRRMTETEKAEARKWRVLFLKRVEEY